jgi:phosphoenolpyruvate synthase/pyruvate phosphate dikinase
MTEINLEDFTEFSKIKDIWSDCFHDKNGLHEFLNNVVMNMDKDCNNGYGKMLPDFSDIYVLVSKKDFPFEKLTSNQKISIDLSVANKNFILGYIWLCPWVLKNEGCIPYHFINFIDSRISGLNISKYMIEKYEETEEENHLFPFEIISGAKYYWKKYFMEVYKIKNKTELSQMIYEYELKKGDIRWDELISAFEM